MNKERIIGAIVALCCSVALTSCGSYRSIQRGQSISLRPDEVRLNMDVENLKPTGEVTITAEYKRYFWIFTDVVSINGEAFDRRTKRDVILSGDNSISVRGVINKAKYKVKDELPTADFYTVTNSEKRTERLFLGRIVEQSATYRGYSLHQEAEEVTKEE